MKTCFKCHRGLPLSEFYKHPMMGDGYLGKCRQCTRQDVRENREKRRNYYNAYDRARAKAGYPGRLAWARRNPGIRKVHGIMARALKKGLLVRLPCEICGDPKTFGHHENYQYPLAVVWLCQRHHRNRHIELKARGIDVYATAPGVAVC